MKIEKYDRNTQFSGLDKGMNKESKQAGDIRLV